MKNPPDSFLSTSLKELKKTATMKEDHKTSDYNFSLISFSSALVIMAFDFFNFQGVQRAWKEKSRREPENINNNL